MRTRHVRSTIAFVTLALTAACGESRSPAPPPAADGGKPTPTSPPAPSTATAPMSPTEMGEAAGGLYVDTLTTVSDAMATNLPPAELRSKLVAWKEAAITRLVDLGRKRKTLDASAQAQMDAAVSLALNSVPSKTFELFAAGQARYGKDDAELGTLIATFNVITQYANFDLLRKQEPAEATRLRID